jgi:hypothetical protein
MRARIAAVALRAAAITAAASLLTSACDTRPRPPSAPAAARSVEVIRREGNHLVGQASPYLEQHAHNPVDWYPWGPEALDRARRERKLVFLSIGYSTCHWCHVMEKESFEDDETARYLNERFVSIKVDREQRPDLDALFIEAVSQLGTSPGWPLTVILTPELEPIFGGTYFARVSAPGRPGLLDVLHQMEQRFHDEGPAIAARGRELLASIAAEARAARSSEEVSFELVRSAMVALGRSRDPVEGGFGTRQKFPSAPLLLAELRFLERAPEGDVFALEVRAHLERTLDRMARGGVHDHLAGTFHRYAVDRAWHVPHFEKTLYDNAQLAAVYLEASRALAPAGKPPVAAYEAVARAVLDDLVARWQRPDGGFVVGFDADDPVGEGAYYTFTPPELQRALGEGDARVFGALFGVTAAGERSLEGRSVLHRRRDEEVLRELHLAPDALAAVVGRALPALVAVRAQRPPPATDDKELASWNGLAVMALADAGRALDEPRYVQAAQRAAHFLVDRCWDEQTRGMRRGLRGGVSLGDGFLDDHALPALGLLRLHAADGDLAWLTRARAIADALVERFHDEAQDAFVHAAAAADTPTLPLRRAELDDGVLPSGAAAAALLLLELGAVAGDPVLHERGLRALRAAAPRVRAQPFSSGYFLTVVDHAAARVHEVVIAGDPADARTRALLRELADATDARAITVRLPADGAPAAALRAVPSLSGKVALGGKATAYVCHQGACDAPTGDPAQLREQLRR